MDNWLITLLQYIERYLQFPPPEHQPTEHELNKMVDKCIDVVRWFNTGKFRIILQSARRPLYSFPAFQKRFVALCSAL